MLGTIAAVLAGGVGYIAYKMGQFTLATKYSKSWLSSQINPIRHEMAKQNIKLIKLPLSAWKELSMGYEKLSSKFSLSGIEIGVIKSVFFEPLILVGKKKIFANATQCVTLVQLDDVEIEYFAEGKTVKVFINENHVGEIKRGNEYHIYGMIFTIDTTTSNEYANLNVNGKYLMKLNNKATVSNLQSARLIEYIDESNEELFVRAMPLIVYYILGGC
jgi:hypothetical protein